MSDNKIITLQYDPTDRAPMPTVIPDVTVRPEGVTPGWLSRALHLDIWGPSLLTRAAARLMDTRARLLAINFLLDMMVWTAVGNLVIHGDSGTTISPATLVALLIALVPSVVLLEFERNVVVADSDKLGSNKLTLGLRAGLIILIALCTSSLVDLVAFAPDIDKRIQREAVNEEVAGQLPALRSHRDLIAQLELRDPDALAQGAVEAAAVEQARKLREEAKGAFGAANAQVEIAKDEVAEAKKGIEAAQRNVVKRQQLLQDAKRRRSKAWSDSRSGDAAALRKLRRARATVKARETSLARARRAVTTAREKEAAARAKVATLIAGRDEAKEDVVAADASESKAKGTLQERRDAIEKDKKAQIAKANAEIERLRRWANYLREAPSLEQGQVEPLTELQIAAGVTPLRSEPRHVGFVQRGRALMDLAAANPPRWPALSPGDKDDIANSFGLRDPSPDTLRAQAFVFNTVHIVLIILAALPAFALLMLKLMSQDPLRLYYSLAAQARNGNPEAKQLRRIDTVLGRLLDGAKRQLRLSPPSSDKDARRADTDAA